MQNISIPNNAAAVTPSDTVNNYGLGLYVGGAGNVSIVTAGGDTVTLVNVQAGSIIPVEFSRVRATSTTATNLVRFW
jgi:hypothetical protein